MTEPLKKDQENKIPPKKEAYQMAAILAGILLFCALIPAVGIWAGVMMACIGAMDIQAKGKNSTFVGAWHELKLCFGVIKADITERLASFKTAPVLQQEPVIRSPIEEEERRAHRRLAFKAYRSHGKPAPVATNTEAANKGPKA